MQDKYVIQYQYRSFAVYKLICSIAFIFATTLLGHWFSEKLTNRRKTLQAISEAISKTETLISFGLGEITGVVIESFCKINGFENVQLFCDEGNSFCESFHRCIDAIPSECSLTEEDKDLLKRFSEGLGSSDLAGQTSNCEYYKKLFDERISEAKEKEKSLKKLYKVLGFSLGCIIILMIV